MTMHREMAALLDRVLDEVERIQSRRGSTGHTERPTLAGDRDGNAEGLDGAKEMDGLPVEGTWRAHQVPVDELAKPGHLKALEDWMRSYHAEELFDRDGALIAELRFPAARGPRRMSANPHANGGLLLQRLKAPRLPQVRSRGGKTRRQLR